jgi:hypothetical protein
MGWVKVKVTNPRKEASIIRIDHFMHARLLRIQMQIRQNMRVMVTSEAKGLVVGSDNKDGHSRLLKLPL